MDIETISSDQSSSGQSKKIKLTEGIETSEQEEQIKASEQEKNVLLMAGCFCPPHKGHFEMLKNNISWYDRAYIFLWNAGVYSRHGFTQDENYNLWKYYIDLLPADQVDKIHIVKLRIASGHPVITGIQDNMRHYFRMADKGKIVNFTILLGSDYTEPKIAPIKANLEINNDKIDNINVDFRIINRNEEDDISATAFVDALKQGIDYDKYLPDEIHEQENSQIKDKVKLIFNNKDKSQLKGGEDIKYSQKYMKYKIKYH